MGPLFHSLKLDLKKAFIPSGKRIWKFKGKKKRNDVKTGYSAMMISIPKSYCSLVLSE